VKFNGEIELFENPADGSFWIELDEHMNSFLLIAIGRTGIIKIPVGSWSKDASMTFKEYEHFVFTRYKLI